MSLINRLFTSQSGLSYESLRCDIHSHLLPGIDDGSKTPEQSLGMLLKFAELGYKKLVLTPHIKWGQFDNTISSIREAERTLREYLAGVDLPLEFDVSAEYFGDEHLLGLIRKRELLPFAGNYILFECSFHYENPLLNEIIASLLAAGYRPVLAHFERYHYYHGSIGLAGELRKTGCLIQMNLLSLLGHYGSEIQQQAKLLVKSGEIDFVGSDCHRMQHLELLRSGEQTKWMQEALKLDLLNRTIFE